LQARLSIAVDHIRFKQILLNLLTNGIKYNKMGGSITLATEDVGSQRVRISVTDTGIGIANEGGAGLFEPFNRLGHETGNIEGTGIGLTIAKQMVESMGGQIGFNSEVGKGSTVWIEFPGIERTIVDAAAAIPEPEVVGDESEPLFPKKMLYIEDNPANLRLMEVIVSTIAKLSLISAHNAELGLIMAEEELPYLIVMDIHLPGTDGIAATRILKSNDKTKHIPVVALTAAVMREDVERGIEAGFNTYVAKPFAIRDMIEVIKKEMQE
jgi:CheY-like chemotaxis protein